MKRSISSDLTKRVAKLRPEHYELNDKGNGQLFADTYCDILKFNVTAREWYWFNGQRWQRDTGGMKAEQKAKELADMLYIYAARIEDNAVRTEYIKHVAKMGSRRVRKTMIEDSRDMAYIEAADLDKDNFLLNCQNGVLNLRTFEFMEHSPDFLMTKMAQAEYRPAASDREWSKFIDEVMQHNGEKAAYLQKLLGYSLTGGTNEECCYLLYGASTRNGKSTLVETYSYMLGGADGYALNMRPETLAQKSNVDSRQASGDIARLNGCRFLNASEPPKKMIFDAALLKTLLGRDSITARHLHQSEFQFVPVFKLFINTNFLPLITDETLFSSGRLNVITFDRHFTTEEQDKGLKERLKRPENLSGLLNWCIEGLKAYYAEGAAPPKCVTAATEEYRASSDKIGNFISECLEESKENSSVKAVYERYAEWCRENGFGTENKSNFTAELNSKGLLGAGLINGMSYKRVVKGYVVGNFDPVDNSAELPFK